MKWECWTHPVSILLQNVLEFLRMVSLPRKGTAQTHVHVALNSQEFLHWDNVYRTVQLAGSVRLHSCGRTGQTIGSGDVPTWMSSEMDWKPCLGKNCLFQWLSFKDFFFCSAATPICPSSNACMQHPEIQPPEGAGDGCPLMFWWLALDEVSEFHLDLKSLAHRKSRAHQVNETEHVKGKRWPHTRKVPCLPGPSFKSWFRQVQVLGLVCLWTDFCFQIQKIKSVNAYQPWGTVFWSTVMWMRAQLKLAATSRAFLDSKNMSPSTHRVVSILD